MEYKSLRSLNANPSLLGFGCMRFPTKENGEIDEAEAEKMLDYAIANGVNYIDTAYPYHEGNSEPFVGRVLKKYPRDRFYLATKLPLWSLTEPADVERIFEEQCRRLQTDTFDFYLLHALDQEKWQKTLNLQIIPFLEKKGGRAAACYIGACLGMYGLTMLIRGAYLLTGQFENFIESAYGYNHLLTIGAATALFYVFKNRETEEGEQTQAKVAAAGEGEKTQRKDAKVGEAKQVSVEAGAAGGPAGIICRIAPCSFGVYLLHEQVNVRYVWPFWLGADRCGSAVSLLWHWAAAILTVMVIGLAVDHIRSLLFRGAGKLFAGGRLDQGLRKIDDLVNGLTQ